MWWLFWNNKKAAKRMEKSILRTLRWEGCAYSQEEIHIHTRIPREILSVILRKMVKKGKIKRQNLIDEKTKKFIGIKYCEGFR